MPARLAEFERVMMLSRQCLEKRFEALEVHRPMRRNLEQDRSQFFFQCLGAREQVWQCMLGLLEFLHVSNEAAALYCKTEAFRRVLAPLGESGDIREFIEAIVDLDRIKVLVVAGKHLG